MLASACAEKRQGREGSCRRMQHYAVSSFFQQKICISGMLPLRAFDYALELIHEWNLAAVRFHVMSPGIDSESIHPD